MKYYIASRWSNMKAVQALTENLQELGHEVFSYVSDKRNFVPAEEIQKREELFAFKDNWRKDEELKKMFDMDLAGLTESDVFILLLPAGKGAHTQAGIAYGFNKRTVLIGEMEHVEIHYMLFDEWHRNVNEYLDKLHQNG